MSFRPCILIPIYNHGDAIAATIDKLQIYKLPIFIIDDGCDDATKQLLSRIGDTHPEIYTISHKFNKGKGAALKTGFRAALNNGFTHALQIDADGQHNILDVPIFLSKGRECPQNLICGQPIYDKSIPKSRIYGRRISKYWVAIETLSLTIPDAMCGYRLYPLNETVSIINKNVIGDRMEFDIEIVVRFAWNLLPIRWIKTNVHYPEGGRSNFRLVIDNLLISWAHTRLVAEMVIHIPMLLKQKATSWYACE